MKEKSLLVLLFFLSFVIYVISSFIFPLRLWDETVYANLGWDLKSNWSHYSFEGKWSDFDPNWPKAGYRAPLLPYMIAVFYSIFGQNEFLLNLLMPFFGALGVIFLYLLTREMFNKKAALYAASFLAVLPVYILFSGRILTDVFTTTFITLSMLLFWIGFEKNKPKFKILCGFVTAVAILARYVAIWLIPVFFVYLLLKYKNLNFLKDKKTIISVFVFLLTLSPWLYYGFMEYNNPLGPLFHGRIAPYYWGGVQSWYSYFEYFPQMFSVVAILFFISLILMIKAFDVKSNNILILLWFFTIFLFSAFVLPHKAERYLLPLVPSLCIISVTGLERMKKYKKEIFVVTVFITFATSISLLYSHYLNSHNTYSECYLKTFDFVNELENNLLIFTDESPIFYYYTHRENHFLPRSHEHMLDLIKDYYPDRPVYYFWHKDDRRIDLKNEIENKYKTVFECPENGSIIKLYRIEF